MPMPMRRILELGRGGMATVFLAVRPASAEAREQRRSAEPSAATEPTEPSIRDLVVIKEMHSDLAEQAEFRRMFVEEARVAARLDHPNIVKTLDVVDEGRGSQAVSSIVMEFLRGQTLSRLRAAGRREIVLPVQLYVISETLSALVYLHALRDEKGAPLRLVHRDVSPQNIIVTYDGDVKLLDFGITKRGDATSQTAVGTLKGKLAYMAPEQVLGHPIDGRTDVFSLGVVLWEALAGRRIWADVPEPAIVGRLCAGAIPTPGSFAPDVPAELEAICLRALASDPSRRYANAAEFKEAVDSFLAKMTSRPTRRELSALVTGLFGEARKKMDAAIRAALASEDVATIRPAPIFESGSSPASSVSPLSQTKVETGSRARPRPRRWPALMALGMAIAVGGLIGALSVAVRPTPSSSSTDADGGNTVARSVPGAPGAAASRIAQAADGAVEPTTDQSDPSRQAATTATTAAAAASPHPTTAVGAAATIAATPGSPTKTAQTRAAATVGPPAPTTPRIPTNDRPGDARSSTPPKRSDDLGY